MDDTAVRSQIAELGSKIKLLDDAMAALLANMQNIDKGDPRFTATMRNYGVLQQLSTFFSLLGDVTTALRPLIDELEARVQP